MFNLKIYGRKTCDDSLELVEELYSEVKWNEGRADSDGGGFSGSVQMQSEL